MLLWENGKKIGKSGAGRSIKSLGISLGPALAATGGLRQTPSNRAGPPDPAPSLTAKGRPRASRLPFRCTPDNPGAGQGFAGILSKKDGTSFNAQGRHNGMTNVGRNNHCLCGSGGKWESIKIREG